eukprot:14437189-Alexandrium_andersonii.AAC.1
MRPRTNSEQRQPEWVSGRAQKSEKAADASRCRVLLQRTEANDAMPSAANVSETCAPEEFAHEQHQRSKQKRADALCNWRQGGLKPGSAAPEAALALLDVRLLGADAVDVGGCQQPWRMHG